MSPQPPHDTAAARLAEQMRAALADYAQATGTSHESLTAKLAAALRNAHAPDEQAAVTEHAARLDLAQVADIIAAARAIESALPAIVYHAHHRDGYSVADITHRLAYANPSTVYRLLAKHR